MRKCPNISPYIRRPLVIYDFATAPLWISRYMRKIWFSFLSVHRNNSLHRVDRMLSFLSNRPNWVRPPHHTQASVYNTPPLVLGGGHTRLRERGWGVPIRTLCYSRRTYMYFVIHYQKIIMVRLLHVGRNISASLISNFSLWYSLIDFDVPFIFLIFLLSSLLLIFASREEGVDPIPTSLFNYFIHRLGHEYLIQIWDSFRSNVG
jgi:hypothetical protein